MKTFAKVTLASVALATALAATAPAISAVVVGGQPMYQSKTIVQNAVNSADHTTLVAAVKAAGLVDTLNQKGPFTVFAPVNSAFAALPEGTVETLLQPANKGQLTKVLTFHVVPGRFTFVQLKNMVRKGEGRAQLKTASGGTLTAQLNGPNNIIIEDDMGGIAKIRVYDVLQSNGVIHSVDKVLVPK